MVKEYEFETIPEFELEEENIPWLTEDKVDGIINIRWFDFWNQFIDYAEITSSTDVTITCWFEPKVIEISAMYPNLTEAEYSETTSSVRDDVWKTMWKYKTVWAWTSISLWDSSSTKAVDLRDAGNECYAYITDVSKTWFTLWTITYNAENAWLHITVLW